MFKIKRRGKEVNLYMMFYPFRIPIFNIQAKNKTYKGILTDHTTAYEHFAPISKGRMFPVFKFFCRQQNNKSSKYPK